MPASIVHTPPLVLLLAPPRWARSVIAGEDRAHGSGVQLGGGHPADGQNARPAPPLPLPLTHITACTYTPQAFMPACTTRVCGEDAGIRVGGVPSGVMTSVYIDPSVA
jgi:hypothetical protein